MNKDRRKEIDSIIEVAEQLLELIESIRNEEEEYRANMPENLQYSVKGETADEAISNLENAEGDLTTVISYLAEAKGEE